MKLELYLANNGDDKTLLVNGEEVTPFWARDIWAWIRDQMEKTTAPYNAARARARGSEIPQYYESDFSAGYTGTFADDSNVAVVVRAGMAAETAMQDENMAALKAAVKIMFDLGLWTDAGTKPAESIEKAIKIMKTYQWYGWHMHHWSMGYPKPEQVFPLTDSEMEKIQSGFDASFTVLK